MSYTYNPGDPVSVLDPSEPATTEIVGVSADEALRQIKAYLLDPTVGPEAKYKVLKAQFDSAVSSSALDTPVGLVFPMPRSADFDDWLLCDGRNVSRTTYSALFAAIGINFGAGDGSTTFGLPDVRGRIPVTVDPTFAVTPEAAPFSTFGSKTHTLTAAENGKHVHRLAPGVNVLFWVDPYPGGYDTNRSVNSNAVYISGGTVVFNGSYPPSTPPRSLDVGGGGSHENIMPTLTLNYFIRK